MLNKEQDTAKLGSHIIVINIHVMLNCLAFKILVNLNVSRTSTFLHMRKSLVKNNFLAIAHVQRVFVRNTFHKIR